LVAHGEFLLTCCLPLNKEKIMAVIKFIFWLAVIALIIVAGPLLTLWAMNTLFPALAIPYSIETWFAVIILAGVFKSNVKATK
jgi:hypothetical protein